MASQTELGLYSFLSIILISLDKFVHKKEKKKEKRRRKGRVCEGRWLGGWGWGEGGCCNTTFFSPRTHHTAIHTRTHTHHTDIHTLTHTHHTAIHTRTHTHHTMDLYTLDIGPCITQPYILSVTLITQPYILSLTLTYLLLCS